MSTTYDVRVWKMQVRYSGRGKDRKPSRYVVRWMVGQERFDQSFTKEAQADSFRSDLMSASKKGEPFDTVTGRPVSWEAEPVAVAVPWFEFACGYVDVRWPDLSPGSRRNLANDLSAITAALLDDTRGVPEMRLLRSAMRVGFNPKRRAAEHPSETAEALRWLAEHTRPVGDLAEPDTMRALVTALDKKLDGQRAAPDTIRMRRTTLASALEYAAVEKHLLKANPTRTVKARKNRTGVRQVDKRAVPNPVQARTLLLAADDIAPRLKAFFALMYYAGLRPEEAANLRKDNLSLPEHGWGEIHLEKAAPEISGAWTDSGEPNEERQLKHREINESRTTPCPPELTDILHGHLRVFGTAPDGRLFWGKRDGGRLSSSVYGRVWAAARRAVFVPSVADSLLAARPYDLRHACVSTWLSAGVEPPRIAQWAGHSLRVLLEVYAKFLDAGETEALRKIQRRLGG